MESPCQVLFPLEGTSIRARSLNDDEKMLTARGKVANDFQGTSGGKTKISRVEMGCLNNFPSPAGPCARQTEGNVSFETCLLQDARKRGGLLRTVMDRSKQAAKLRGESC